MSYLFGGLLLFVGAMLLVSCLVALVGAPEEDFLILLAAIPGRFFFGAFHIAGLFVPAYVIASGLFLLRPAFRRASFIVLNLSVLPFFTLSLLLQLGAIRQAGAAAASEGPLAAAVAGALTPLGGMILCLVLLLVEVVLIAVAAGLRPLRRKPAARQRAGRDSEESYRAGYGQSETDGQSDGPTDEPARPTALLSAPFSDPADAEEPAEIEEIEVEVEEAGENEPVAKGGLFDFAPAPDIEEDELEPAPESEADADPEGDVFFFHNGRILDGNGTQADEPKPGLKRKPGKSRGRGAREYRVPIAGILSEYEDGQYWEIDEETKKSAEILRYTLEEFQIQAEVTGIRKGPVITMFEILPAPGVKLAKIVNLADNIALRLAAQSVRIVAPIPGKHAVGIEIPNRHRAIVSFAELVSQESFWDPKVHIPVAIGKDIPGEAQIVDLTKMPHVLIAGATGSGKSVCVNSIICSVLYRKRPDEVKLILIDPKIVELKFYNDIPHLLTPVITDPKRAFQALQYAIYEMERRYSLLDSLGVRDIRSYNNRVRQRNLATEQVPYIVIVVDEFADLMSTTGKELESTVARLAAMSRAVGIHLVLATQRPSTDVITGLIKANIPSRIAFMVASKIDSRIIIDSGGAEKLLGGGDMLFASAWDPFPFRMQGAFVSEEEVERIVAHVKTLGEPDYIDDEIFIEDDDDTYLQENLEDPLMEQAINIVVSAGKASASYLQRRLKVGYNRAARLVEEMERIGVVGPQQGSKPREILHIPDHVG